MKKLLIASLMAIFLSGFSAHANFSSNFSSFINIANITQDEDQMMVQEEPVVESASFTQEIKKKTIVVITHDDEIVKFGDHLIYLK